MRIRLALTGLVLTTAMVLAACGGDSEPADTAPDTSTPTQADSEQADSEQADSSPASTANFADCSAIPAEAMDAVLGEGTATAEVPPAGQSCTYALEENPELPSVNIDQMTVDDFANGWEGAKERIAHTEVGVIDATPQSVPGIGDDAILVSGPTGEGSVPDTIGLVRIGDMIVRAYVLDSSGKSPDELATVTTNILRVIADHA